MLSAARIMPEPPPRFPPFPGWARQKTTPIEIHGALFVAGAALAALHPIAVDAHDIGMLWRQRLALGCAATLARQGGRSEDETTLRDHWYLRRDGDDPGPAGRVLQVWRKLGERSAADPQNWRMMLAATGGGKHAAVADIINLAGEISATATRAPIIAAAEIVAACVRALPRDDLTPLWLADAILAQRMRWHTPVPLIATNLRRSALRAAPHYLNGDQTFMIAFCAAYARAAETAVDLYAELGRRAGHLLAIAPKLRSRDADDTVQMLMSEDAQAADGGRTASDRSSRRLFERLVALGAARELTGRTTFRLYGL